MKDNVEIAKDYTDWHIKHGGFARDMTMRDYFAGLGLNIIISEWEDHPDWDLNHIANSAYEIADAMLLERVKK